MGHQLNVYVLDSDGDPVAGTEARIYIDGTWKGGTLDAHTDNDGHPKIETAADHEDSREPYSPYHYPHLVCPRATGRRKCLIHRAR